MRILRATECRPWTSGVQTHFLPFDMEADKWEMVTDPLDAEIIPITYHWPQDELLSALDRLPNDVIVLDTGGLFHSDDTYGTIEFNQLRRNIFADHVKDVIVLHTNHSNTSETDVHYDIMWNRQKLYFTEYDAELVSGRLWTFHCDQRMYELGDLVKGPTTKTFLSPSRIYQGAHDLVNPRIIARMRLFENLPKDNAWYSDFKNGLFLQPQQQSDDITRYMLSFQGGTWWPVSNHYYESSYISVYVETITRSLESALITEKTYDPLIKGHYILPFAYPSMINDIRKIGFWLPDWIDYSYDQILDYDHRLDAFIEVVRSVSKIPIGELHERWLSEVPMLQANRKLFWDRPYDTLYEKIRKRTGLR